MSSHLKPYQFKPGNPGGPGCGKNWLRSSDMKRVVGKIMVMSKDELKQFMARPDATMLELICGKVIELAADNGDAVRMEFLLSRVIGRAKPVEEDDDDDGVPLAVIKRPDGSVVEFTRNKSAQVGPSDEKTLPD